MARKTFLIAAGPLGRRLLTEAIRCFAAAAYPPGGSDCAQVARETLLTTAAAIEGSSGEVRASIRQRALLRQAVQWYAEHVDALDGAQRDALNQALQGMLRGEQIEDESLAVFA